MLFLISYGPSYPLDSNLLDKLISLFVGQKLYPCPAEIRDEALGIIAGCILMNQKTFSDQLVLSLESLTDRAATELLEMTGGVPPLPSEQIPASPVEKAAIKPIIKKGLQPLNKIPGKSPLPNKSQTVLAKSKVEKAKPKPNSQEPFKLTPVAQPSTAKQLLSDACISILMMVCSLQKPKDMKNFSKLFDQLTFIEVRETPFDLRSHKYFK